MSAKTSAPPKVVGGQEPEQAGGDQSGCRRVFNDRLARRYPGRVPGCVPYLLEGLAARGVVYDELSEDLDGGA